MVGLVFIAVWKSIRIERLMIGIDWKLGFVAVAILMMQACDQSMPAPASDTPAATVSSENVEEALAAGQEYFASGDLAKAKAILTTLIDRAPTEVRGRELYGQVLTAEAIQADQNRNAPVAAAFRQQAYEQYRIAVELTPNNAGLQQSAGMMALGAKRVDDAIAHFRAASKLDPTNTQYPVFEAQLLISQQKFEEARALLQGVLKVDSDVAVAHASLAMIDLEMKQYESALNHISAARQIEPQNVEFRAQEARIFRRQGEPQRVLELLIGLAAADQAREIVTFEMAAAYTALGEHANAARAWENCFRANPSAPNAWLAAVRSGESMLKAGKPEAASHWLQQAKLIAPAQDAPEILALESSIQN